MVSDCPRMHFLNVTKHLIPKQTKIKYFPAFDLQKRSCLKTYSAGPRHKMMWVYGLNIYSIFLHHLTLRASTIQDYQVTHYSRSDASFYSTKSLNDPLQ